ncbi:MAG: ROK family protein [Paracoccaceae bacterium]
MKNIPADRFNLVADIGGTNTRVALANGKVLLPETTTKYSNHNFSDLGSVLHQFIRDQGNVDCAGACVAVAGPVRDGIGEMTNLNWSIDRPLLASATKAEKVAILNDLQAQGHSLYQIEPQSFSPILSTPNAPQNGTKLVVGIGTGFNASVVINTGEKLLVPPSETGHIDLPVQNQSNIELAEYVRQQLGFCAIDDVLSGRGIEMMYRWHALTQKADGRLSSHGIFQAVEQGANPVATETLRHFIQLAGYAIGNLALTHLPFGGIYLAGGMARAVAPYLVQYNFEKSFKDKGRFREFMDNFSVSIIQDDAAALTGCANFLNAKT